ncbi:hypothetical protein BX616_006102, partial [Lobosporangium transversale]
MDQQRLQDNEQRKPLLSQSQQPSGSYNTLSTVSTYIPTSHHDQNKSSSSSSSSISPLSSLTNSQQYHEDENDINKNISKDDNSSSGWKARFHTISKFFQGLGKFFLILAVGTIILVLVLQYTLPRVDEEQRKDLHFPHSLEDLEALRKILV